MPVNSAELAGELATELLKRLADLAEPVQVCREIGGLTCMIQVFPTVAPPSTQKVGAIPRATAGERRAKCRQDIVDTVRAVGRALTRKQIVSEMKKAGTPHGSSTVAKALAELTKAGQLVNHKDKHGYRLAEWPKPSQTPSLLDLL